jgi:ribosomal protein L20
MDQRRLSQDEGNRAEAANNSYKLTKEPFVRILHKGWEANDINLNYKTLTDLALEDSLNHISASAQINRALPQK